MLRNYIKVGFRNLLRQKTFSLINILGLAAGLASGILIFFWIQYELSYDKHLTDASNIYRITAQVQEIEAAIVPAPLAAAIEEELPQVTESLRLSMMGEYVINVNDKKYREDRIFHADSNFFDFFSYALSSGDPMKALTQPQSIVLSRAMAEKYFGTTEVLGNTLRLNNKDDFTVTGVLKDYEKPSHLRFDFLLPMEYLARSDNDLRENRWDNYSFYAYIKTNGINSAGEIDGLESGINKLYTRHENELEVHLSLQPLTEIHLKSDFMADLQGHGNSQYVKIFFIIAVVILLIACINFMNLATARSSRRAREVGFRKVAGAKRKQLIWQFLVESSLVSFISLLAAVLLIILVLPGFRELTGIDFNLRSIDLNFVLTALGLTLVIGLVSGSYPALYLSGFTPIRVLNLQRTSRSGSQWFRNSLVTTQFVFSIVLIIATLAVRQQQQFIKNQNLGFDKENLVYVNLDGKFLENKESLKNALSRNSLTENYSIIGDLPTDLLSGTINVEWKGKNPDGQVVFAVMQVDEGFVEVFDMQMASGRNFSKDFGSDERSYLVNETALKIMNMEAASAIGQNFSLWGDKGTIAGVVKDFHFKPIKEPIEPLVLRYSESGAVAVVRTQPGQTENTIKELETLNAQLNPSFPFEYGFVDQDLDNLYQSEKRLSRLVNIFAILAIFISCLGLYGLSTFFAEQRKKEIGVRKVVGASIAQLNFLLSKDFTKPIWIAMFVAVPLAYFYVNKWLDTFAYHINLELWILLLSCVVAWLIAIVSISFVTIRAASANPAIALGAN